jgi:DNA-binding CsgD family transcriptional regulator
MKTDPCIDKPWKISKKLEKNHTIKRIEEQLSFFNRACKGNFYMVNYYEQKLIVGTSNASTFCGYPKDMIEKEGFDFYKRILKKNELIWLEKMNAEAYNVFFNFREPERQNLEFNYDLIVETVSKDSVVLHHRLVPYKLCENGNMWLGLCFVSLSPYLLSSCQAHIVNQQTSETYDFIDNKFVLSDVKALTLEEISILNYLTKDMMTKQIVDLLDISESTIMRKKNIIFDKLGVKSSYAAIHKAAKLGII